MYISLTKINKGYRISILFKESALKINLGKSFVYSFVIFVVVSLLGILSMIPLKENLNCDSSNFCTYKSVNALNIMLQDAEFNLYDIEKFNVSYTKYRPHNHRRNYHRRYNGNSFSYGNDNYRNNQTRTSVKYQIDFKREINNVNYITVSSQLYERFSSYYYENKKTNFRYANGFKYNKEETLLHLFFIMPFFFLFMFFYVYSKSRKS